MIKSSKRVSSQYLAKWVGVSKKSTWKMMHAVRTLMGCDCGSLAPLECVVEVGEKYVGGKPRFQRGAEQAGARSEEDKRLRAWNRQGSVRVAFLRSSGGYFC